MIWRGNLREDWQEGFYEIQEADCMKKGRIRKQTERRKWTNAYSRSLWEERNRGEVEELCAIEVYTVSEVTNTDVADMASIRHVKNPGHV